MNRGKMQYHHKSIRLPNYDYSSPGFYFLTLCTFYRSNLFGEIETEIMNENWIAQVAREEWLRSSEIRSEIKIDSFVIMPNHIHGIVQIVDYAENVFLNESQTLPKRSIGAIVAGFKSAVSKRIIEKMPEMCGKIWQRNYWEHVIRNDDELFRIRRYIQINPLCWELDQLNGGSGNLVL